MSALIRVEGLRAALGGREVLRGVDLEVRAGERVALVGPNGAGKSTLMRAALGLISCNGIRWLGGDRLEALAPRARARRVAWLPQEREIAWDLPVGELVALGRGPWRAPGRGLGPEDRAAVARALARMDLCALEGRAATALSGGERARALIARALAQETPLLLADEPTAGLDPAHQLVLAQAFSDLAAEGRGVVASLHDLGLAARWASRVVLLAGGRVVADGPPRAVFTAERLAAVYGVRARIDWEGEAPVVLPVALA